ncbi:hypothetical protein JJV70_11275 [Streptomyces sp. JJ66]|uniref:hypothetical protein n=1 Tax=Streptomyces sp. JJ66 TaxID=2803843 RepID=UPI001C5926C2|nr:hypothetical protein [Streptomyces sp. JJ66]MBW1602679.1 hypothetical protein [Streptomyces sp. JJ66]
MTEQAEVPAVGDTVFDTRQERVGVYQANVDGELWLRPIGGGREWTADPGHVRRPTDRELISERVRIANRESRTR